MTNKRAIILSSGGLDSTTVLAMAQAQGYDCYCLSFDYGQRHRAEIIASERIAKAAGAKEHKVARLDLSVFGGSALTDMAIDVPEDETEMGNIPITYVPARNTVFLSYALAWAEVLQASDIFIGVNSVDYSGYPDCRPEFVHAMNVVSKIANYHPVEIVTPYLKNTKSEILKSGLAMGLNYADTWTCYNGRHKACGRCGSCIERLEAFAEQGKNDPIDYE